MTGPDSQPADRALEEVFIRWFQEDELRLWLLSLPDGDVVARWLPSRPASIALVAHAAVMHLIKLSAIDTLFFDALADARPRRLQEVESLAKAWAVPWSPASTADTRLKAAERVTPSSGQATSELLVDLRIELETLVNSGGDPARIEALRSQLRAQGHIARKAPPQRAEDILADRFVLKEIVGSGGFATVWRAWDTLLERSVALKILHGHHADNRTRRDRFVRGARAMARLQHSNIVRVLDVSDPGSPIFYFSMELIVGTNLLQAVERRQLDHAAALRVVDTMAVALQYAHSRGVVHRDVKPQNILLREDGTALLTDFDLARVAESEGGTTSMVGTFLFAAPEQLDPGQMVDGRADVFGLAMTTLHALKGGPLSYNEYRDPCALLSRLPLAPSVQAALRKATELDPEDRFPTMQEFRAALLAHATQIWVPPPKEAPDALAELLTAVQETDSAPEPWLQEGLQEVLSATCLWFAESEARGRVAEATARARLLLGEVLMSSTTASLALTRRQGEAERADLFGHVIAGLPDGRDSVGRAFDRALLRLPTLQGWRWRDESLAQALADVLPRSAGRVLLVSLAAPLVFGRVLTELRERDAQVTSVQLLRPSLPGVQTCDVPITVLEADLGQFLRGFGPDLDAAFDAIIVDRVCDALPSAILRLVLRWAQSQLLPAGRLLIGHALPARDSVMLDHLLGWPSLPRTTSEVERLLPPGGHRTIHTAGDAAAGGLVVWTERE